MQLPVITSIKPRKPLFIKNCFLQGMQVKSELIPNPDGQSVH